MSELHKMARPWKPEPAYRAYLKAQIHKTFALKDTIQGSRVANLVGHLVRSLNRSPIGLHVLAVGCRNRFEVDVLHAAGFTVTGIDLVSLDPRILAMDMHALAFMEETFDAVFACHSLEHAYDVGAALREWYRVTKRGGFWALEVPIGFQRTEVDRQDFGSLNGLREVVWPHCRQEHVGEEERGKIARLVVQA